MHSDNLRTNLQFYFTAQNDIDSKDHQKILSSNDDKLKVLDAKITVIDDKVSKKKAAGASDPKTGILKCPNGSIVFSLCEASIHT